MDFIFQRRQQQNHPHALLMMWLWYSSHKRWGSTFPSLASRQTRGHSESDTVWFPKLGHSLPLLGTPALGTCRHTGRTHKQPHGETTVPADSSSWGPSRQPASNHWRCEQVSPLMSSHSSLWIFPAEAPDITQQRQSQPIVPFPNFWPRESMNLKQWWFFNAT